MQDHALPQDVTGYRFHIIGNMTLKQFAEVAAGCVVGFFIYQTNLPAIFKWPAILFVAGLGAFAAFIPFEEQPFDHWIIALFRALYRPTQFYWKRANKIPEPFLYQPNTNRQNMVAEVDLTPARKQRVKEFLHSVQDASSEIDEQTEQENQRIASLMDSFTSTPTTPQPIQQTQIEPEIIVSPDVITEVQVSEPVPNIDIQLQAPINEVDTTPVETSPLNVFKAINEADQTSEPQISLSETAAANAVTFTNPTPSPVAIPKQELISVEHSVAEMADEAPNELAELQQNDQVYVDSANPTTTIFADAAPATKNTQLPFPQKPTKPNQVVGMVLDAQNNSLPNTIVEILTAEGFSARAVKTNLLGQFFITTPLNNGQYTIVAENDGYQFAPQQLIVNGTVLDPIEVRSAA